MIIDKEEITLADIDEAISHLAGMLKDKYGNKLTHQRKAFLMGELDSLLDARLEALSELGNGKDRESNARPSEREKTLNPQS
jgi:hypothetical protein